MQKYLFLNGTRTSTSSPLSRHGDVGGGMVWYGPGKIERKLEERKKEMCI